MLSIKGLKVSVDDKIILHGVDLQVGAGEVHAIMGPNGSGKSTLAHVLAGREGYQVMAGEVSFDGQELLQMETEARAHSGIFLAMQYPVELPGVNSLSFLKAMVNAKRAAMGEPPLDAVALMKLVRSKLQLVGMDEAMLKRAVNSGYSGGEKKRNEIFQMALLEPRLAILDETDSGLDIDALRVVADGVNTLRSAQRSMILVTHYQRLLNYIEPDYVHVLSRGCIVKSGDKTLAMELEQHGYSRISGESAA